MVDLSGYATVTVPADGKEVTLKLSDGRKVSAVIPAGLRPGDEFEVFAGVPAPAGGADTPAVQAEAPTRTESYAVKLYSSEWYALRAQKKAAAQAEQAALAREQAAAAAEKLAVAAGAEAMRKEISKDGTRRMEVQLNRSLSIQEQHELEHHTAITQAARSVMGGSVMSNFSPPQPQPQPQPPSPQQQSSPAAVSYGQLEHQHIEHHTAIRQEARSVMDEFSPRKDQHHQYHQQQQPTSSVTWHGPLSTPPVLAPEPQLPSGGGMFVTSSQQSQASFPVRYTRYAYDVSYRETTYRRKRRCRPSTTCTRPYLSNRLRLRDSSNI
jgi:hypothetical protein